jgi:hypothetical protein
VVPIPKLPLSLNTKRVSFPELLTETAIVADEFPELCTSKAAAGERVLIPTFWALKLVAARQISVVEKIEFIVRI